MRKIKIAVIGTRGIPGLQGGVEVHCEELYSRLADMGCNVTVYARKGYVDSNLRSWRGINIVSSWAPKRKSIEAIIHTFWGILQIFRCRNKYDIIHIHAIGPSLLIPLTRLLGFNTVIATNHGPDYERQKWGKFAKKMLRLGECCVAKFASEVISVSRHTQNLLFQQYGRKSFYIPNGVSLPNKIPPGDALDKYGLKPNRYILAVGRLVPEKGFHDLIEVFNEISTDWKLVIAGSADHEDDYSLSLKKSAEKNPRVIMTGFVNRNTLDEIFSNAKGFVLPSYHEGLPIVLLEAMSYALPILASNIPANLELVSDKEYTFPCGDKKALKKKLVQLIKTSSKAKSIVKNKQRLENEFNWDQIAKETLIVYAKAVVRAKASGYSQAERKSFPATA